MASVREKALNEAAMAYLNVVAKELGGEVAKSATALKRLLASDDPNASAMEKRVQAFAEAAVKLSASRPRSAAKKKSAKGKAGSAVKKTKKMATKRRGRDYSTAIFKCWGDYQKCCENGNKKVCAALAALCIAKQLNWHIATAALVGAKYLSGH
jgi:hypothetical protein